MQLHTSILALSSTQPAIIKSQQCILSIHRWLFLLQLLLYRLSCSFLCLAKHKLKKKKNSREGIVKRDDEVASGEDGRQAALVFQEAVMAERHLESWFP